VAGKADTATAEAGEDELEKLVAKTKSIRSLVKTIPELGDALVALDARIAGLRADRLKAKPGSERLRQLETETKRTQAALASVTSKRAAAQERIAKEQAIMAKLDADGVELAAAITKLPESMAKLAEEIQAAPVPAPMQQEVWHEATATSQEDSQDLESWLEGDSLAFVKEQRAAMGDDKFLQLDSILKGKGKGVRAGPYG
jgi:chromosome segregation ATPase